LFAYLGRSPILDRLSVDADMWVSSVKHFGRWFHRAASRVEHLMQAATAAAKRWFTAAPPSANAPSRAFPPFAPVFPLPPRAERLHCRAFPRFCGLASAKARYNGPGKLDHDISSDVV